MTDADLRLSDAERDAAGRALGEHFAQGRLTADEHGERLDRIWAARTRGEIAPVFRDLPGGYGQPAPPPRPTGRFAEPYGSTRSRRRRFPVPLLALAALLVALTVVSHVPFFLFALVAFWFVAHRHGHHRSHHRAG